MASKTPELTVSLDPPSQVRGSHIYFGITVKSPIDSPITAFPLSDTFLHLLTKKIIKWFKDKGNEKHIVKDFLICRIGTQSHGECHFVQVNLHQEFGQTALSTFKSANEHIIRLDHGDLEIVFTKSPFGKGPNPVDQFVQNFEKAHLRVFEIEEDGNAREIKLVSFKKKFAKTVKNDKNQDEPKNQEQNKKLDIMEEEKVVDGSDLIIELKQQLREQYFLIKDQSDKIQFTSFKLQKRDDLIQDLQDQIHRASSKLEQKDKVIQDLRISTRFEIFTRDGFIIERDKKIVSLEKENRKLRKQDDESKKSILRFTEQVEGNAEQIENLENDRELLRMFAQNSLNLFNRAVHPALFHD